MYLEQILNRKQQEVSAQKALRSLPSLLKALPDVPPTRSFLECLSTGSGLKLIAELKKASPSRGLLCPDFHPERLAMIYETAGAAAISVLTDCPFFQGSLHDLSIVKQTTERVALLRKDFIIDQYQLTEARVYGADAVLLIAAALPGPLLKKFILEARDLEMTPLVEVHDLRELETALESEASVIGINNRDLRNFTINLETTFKLLSAVPKEILVVSESGIKERQDLIDLESVGVNAVLVGETIVTAPDPGAKIKELLGVA